MKISLDRVIVGKNSIVKEFDLSSYTKVIVELGCGDGKFAYHYAKEHPAELIIATDADKFQFQEISRKAAAKIEKGGVPNVVYLWAAAENLPAELGGVANAVKVNFPWGKLLKGLLTGEVDVLSSVANTLKPGAEFVIYTTYAKEFEAETIAELGLPSLLDLKSLKQKLNPLYTNYQMQIKEINYVINSELIPITTWWKKIGSERERAVVKLSGIKSSL